jgi:hypothetical protein
MESDDATIMNDELGKIWKERQWRILSYHPNIFEYMNWRTHKRFYFEYPGRDLDQECEPPSANFDL